MQDARLGSGVASVIQEAQSRSVKYFACNSCWEGDWQKVGVQDFHLVQTDGAFGQSPSDICAFPPGGSHSTGL